MSGLKRQKVLFFLQSNVGGAERMTIQIASFLDDDKYEVIFYIVGNEYGVIANFIPKSIPYKLVKIKSFRDFLTLKLINVIYKEKPQIVFSSSFPINARLGFASGIFPKLKVILRSDNYLYTQSTLQKLRLFFAYRFSDYLITQTDEMREEHVKVLKLKESKVVRFSNPVDTETIEKKLSGCQSPFDEKKVNYVYVGRIVKSKGLDILFESFSKIVLEKPESLLYIVGETDGFFADYYGKMVLLIEQLGIKDKVIFTGFNENPYNYMKHANCVVLSSWVEGLPNVIIEALYMGTPVAVTNCIPVIKRIVNEGINGFVAEVGDVTGFKEAMLGASILGNIQSTYKPASRDDFQMLFAS